MSSHPTTALANAAPPRTAPSSTSDAVEPQVRFLSRAIGWILAASGLIGALTAFALTLDKLALLRDPAHVPSCSIDPLLSCGPVMASPQAELLGFPNPLIGLIGFPIVATTGAVVLAGAKLPRWYWIALQCATTAAVIFVHWLILQSLYRIGALCPYCMVVWIVTITSFWYLTLHNLASGRLVAHPRCKRAGIWLASYHSAVLVGWFLLIAALIANAFWFYWVTLAS